MKEVPLELIPVFKALGCRTRLGMLALLAEERLCVGAIADKLEMTQPSVSQHLKILRQAGLVKSSRTGYHTHYTVDRSRIEESVAALVELLAHEREVDTVENDRKEENTCANASACIRKD